MCSSKTPGSIFVYIVGFLTALAIAAVIVAFATPYWYRSDPFIGSVFTLPYQTLPFNSLGLWMLCYRSRYPNSDPYHRYETECRSLVNTFGNRISYPPFFVATQVIYTIGLGISCIGFLMLIVALFIGATRRFLYALGTVFVIGALIMGGALIIFGATDNSLWSNNRSEWVFGKNPYSENELFWSFWLAVAGSSLLFLCGLSYFIEGQRQEIAVPVPKPVTVTTVYYPSGQDFIPYTAV